jgi:diguanylate cyclase (GGDEF)-like protein
MPSAKESSFDDPPELAYARQLQAGFPRLSFAPVLEQEFRRVNLDQTIGHVRANVVFAILLALAFSAMEALVLGRDVNQIPCLVHILIIVPTLIIVLGVSFSPRRHALHAPFAVTAAVVYGLCQVVIQVVATRHGVTLLFPSMVLAIMYAYLMAGLIFKHALAANLLVMAVYLAVMAAQRAAVLAGAGTPAGLQPITAYAFSYDALAIVAANLVGASVAFLQEKTSRMRFLEAGLLREMVARDGLTGIQNRRTFDEHIQRCWQQAVRERQRVAVLLVDIDCFKHFNDRYGHQAGDECLRAVAVSLVQCARRPLDFVARYGGEEFALVLYQVSREYVSELLIRIQRTITELNIPHEASLVASRLTVSIGAAYVLPSAKRTHEGLVQLADEALYNAKEQGRNRAVVMEAEYQSLQTGSFDKRRRTLAGQQPQAGS